MKKSRSIDVSRRRFTTYTPGDGISNEEMSEEFSDISQFDILQTMNDFILVLKDLLEAFDVFLFQQTEPLAKQAEEPFVGSLLGATIQNHLTQFHLAKRFFHQRTECLQRALPLDRDVDSFSIAYVHILLRPHWIEWLNRSFDEV